MPNKSAHGRLQVHAENWGVAVDSVCETRGSLIAFGHRSAIPVVLKVVKRHGDEWFSGAVLESFGGRGVVRIYEHEGGALLLERLSPGHSLVDMCCRGEDEAATAIMSSVIATMSPTRIPDGCPTVAEWGTAFDGYLASNDHSISRSLVLHAQNLFGVLADSQTRRRLLHGDFQHSNVLFDRERGWIAIDPKGVAGEPEYETAAMIRNPAEAPVLFTDPSVIERRLRQLSSVPRLDPIRVLGWAFAQSVLSVIWDWEDGIAVDANIPVLVLAESLQSML
jgi:streptomycin 6-kinase